ncbi:unnamed protein product [Protopolystoma xenopodis]|uniref:Uncharacterized protein n=1 Tax=Protopolystoma xenopodis TaxID=117903 RepID=A0A3S5BF01_9PLAT|nr:unnamed protein product [Protopolystoma xenopodis]
MSRRLKDHGVEGPMTAAVDKRDYGDGGGDDLRGGGDGSDDISLGGDGGKNCCVAHDELVAQVASAGIQGHANKLGRDRLEPQPDQPPLAGKPFDLQLDKGKSNWRADC